MSKTKTLKPIVIPFYYNDFNDLCFSEVESILHQSMNVKGYKLLQYWTIQINRIFNDKYRRWEMRYEFELEIQPKDKDQRDELLHQIRLAIYF